jgi:CelD/BcsL family acetyltransferase involved in cellulose biosynthesis
VIPYLVIEPVGFDELRPGWTNLASFSAGIFATWEWADAWWRHYGRGAELLLHACRDADGALVAVVPLYVWQRWPLRVLRFIGHGPSDELGPVTAPTGDSPGHAALRLTLERLDWNVFFGELLPFDLDWAELAGGRVWRRESTPRMLLAADGWPAYLAERSAGFRQQIGRRRRRLEELGARYRLADAASLDHDLDTLFALHRARWGGRRTDFVDSPFQREINRTALARGWLRLWLLELGGRPIAAWHGFSVGGVVSYYQAGRDPDYDHLAPGFALMAHSVEQAFREDASEYRFGRGDEAFKFRFGAEATVRDAVAIPRGSAGRLALYGAGAARAARNHLSASRVLRRRSDGG